ncbi:unnamed protein product [Ceutorhynchus assimilis]|uniref:Dynein heavy chain linker domain-containing protein n=1 Tax=Ceutorhynchus assimilis TaxID=467358 RepID=A0A9N9MQQ1_9CUCU|nr:unnamed protein product [Ceutorhynchus assimilis]
MSADNIKSSKANCDCASSVVKCTTTCKSCSYCERRLELELLELDKLKIRKKRRETLKTFQWESCKETKLKEYKNRLTPLYPEVPRVDTSYKILRGFAETSIINNMSYFQELAIRKKVIYPNFYSNCNNYFQIQKKILERRYPQIVDNIMKEAREHFKMVTHEAGVNLKIKARRSEGHKRLQPMKPYKYLGRTENYPAYLAVKRQITTKFLLHHQLVRRILYECVVLLPETLCDISNLRSKPNDIKELDAAFKKCIEESESAMKKLHNRVVEITVSDQTKAKVGNVTYFHLLKLCNGILSVHFGQALYRTINHIVDITGNEDLVPYLKLSISYTDTLELQPTAADLNIIYSVFVSKLVESANKFLVLEYYRKHGYSAKYLKIFITEVFVVESVERQADNIIMLYEPITRYVKRLDEDFAEIYTDLTIIGSVSEGGSTSSDALARFNYGCEQIRHYQNYIKKASSMLSSEYFAVGQLILSEYVITMKESLSLIIDKVFTELCQLHMMEDELICKDFENLKEYALTKPSTSEDLIEQDLVEFGTLTEEHMELNSKTIQWIKKIEPVLDVNASMYEQIKFEYEERLQATIRNVNERIEKLIPMLGSLDEMDDFERCREYVDQIKVHLVVLRDLREKITWISKEQKCLGFNITPFKNVEDVENWMYPFFHLIKVCMNIKRHINVWLDGPFEFLFFDEAEQKIDEYMKELMKIQKTYRMKLRQAAVDNAPVRFFGALDDPDLFAWPSPLKLTARGIQRIKDFRPAMTLMRIICNDALVRRHWKEMSLIAGFDLTPNAGTSLRKLTQMGLEPDLDNYDVISSGATKERELYRNLVKMQKEWDDIYFKTGQFKDSGVTILTALDDIQVILDDHILKALTMRGSIFVKPYETEVRAFYDKLVRINLTIEEWGQVQSQWLYLLPIFSSKDIVAQMPEEGALFKEVNDTYKRYMDVVLRDPRVFVVAGAEGVYEIMQHCNELLEKINEGVTAYLEKKRLYFPRFFFLSNDEMLEILSETKDPLRVQPHLKKCFEAIYKLHFTEQLEILAMYSQESEKVNFRAQVNTKEAGGSVEKWLVQVEEQMVISVRDQILKSYKSYFLMPRTQWVQRWPGQVILCVSQTHWTLNVHKALSNEDNFTVSALFDTLQRSLTDIVALIRDPSLSNLSRITIKVKNYYFVRESWAFCDFIKQYPAPTDLQISRI